MALLVSNTPAHAAGVFTTNTLCAAPVRLDRERIPSSTTRAIIINAGNANACTGAAGLEDARQMAALTAEALDCPDEAVLVCSTGHIGHRLPMDRISSGVTQAVEALSTDGADAALAIMTADTRPKAYSRTLEVDGQTVTLTGLAKGAGMIEPKMATMLSFLLTDAAIPAELLQTSLKAAVDDSFNRITVDGDQSTNDTVLMMANGASGISLDETHPQWPTFIQLLQQLTLDLAQDIVKDGEGATHFITVEIEGAANDSEADTAARAIANSLLVKTGWAGIYSVWGRIMDALGYCGAELNEDAIHMWYDELQVVEGGLGCAVTQEQVRAVTGLPAYTVRVQLGVASGAARVYTCDITEEYVRINLV